MSTPEVTLEVLRSVRTSDVSDALDSMGLQERYVMAPHMRPLFPGIQFAGIAHTAEYDVFDRPVESMTYETFAKRQYAEGPEGLWREAGPWGATDEVLVIDAKGSAAGILGSSNTLKGRGMGTVGFVIDGACRDSYECTIQKTPAFCTVRSPAHPMGRIRAVSDNQPIVCAGVAVEPGDLIVADDDGIVVVPRDIAEEVAERARRIQEADRPSRRDGYRKLGLPFDETVRLVEPPAQIVDYDPVWPVAFDEIRGSIQPALADVALAVEHVGSTAVPGLAGKPIIDIDVVLAQASQVPAAIGRLDALDYWHQGDLGVVGREAFRSPPGGHYHHLYVVVEGSKPHRDHIDLRDHLREHPDEARRYAKRKRALAHLLVTDREAYTSGKSNLIEDMLARARRSERHPHEADR